MEQWNVNRSEASSFDNSDVCHNYSIIKPLQLSYVESHAIGPMLAQFDAELPARSYRVDEGSNEVAIPCSWYCDKHDKC